MSIRRSLSSQSGLGGDGPLPKAFNFGELQQNQYDTSLVGIMMVFSGSFLSRLELTIVLFDL